MLVISVPRVRSPDSLQYQDVTPKIHLFIQKHKWWTNYFCSVSYADVNDKAYYVLQDTSMNP
ncbi:hypothetical protein ACP70R_049178 [Stipagrostis hirtigluma subsp. patula]